MAALLVAVLHLTNGFLDNLDTTVFTMLVWKGYLAVDLFFLMSGFVIAHVYGERFADGASGTEYLRFVGSRVARLYPMHIAMLAAFVCFEAAWRGVVVLGGGSPPPLALEGHFSIAELLRQALLLHGLWNELITWNFPSWSISSEFFTYLLFPFIAAAFWRCRTRSALLAVLVLFAGLAWLERSHGGLGFVTGPTFLRCLFEFSIGALLYRVHRSRKAAVLLSRDWVFAAAAAATVAMMHFAVDDILIVPVLILLMLSAVANEGRVRRRLNARPLVFLGEISYSIYIVHAFILRLAQFAVGALTGDTGGSTIGFVSSLGIAAALLLLVVLLSAFTYRHIELPARDCLRGLLKSGAGPAA